jgi:hypothetical protein
VTITSEELAVIGEAVVEDTPDSKLQVGAFEPTEGTKKVLVDLSGFDSKVLRISADLSPK